MTAQNCYFLMTGQIMGKLNQEPISVPVNTVYASENGSNITLPQLTKIQESFLHSFENTVLAPEDTFEVSSVTIVSSMFLGIMTPAEFAGETPSENATDAAVSEG